MTRFITLATAILCLQSTAATSAMFEYAFEQLAPGVWTGVRPDPHRFPVMGNVTFIISDKGVVVYDGGGVPAMAEQVIDKIRSLTNAPVTHVVTSHWHGDHNFGIYRFGEEFPNVQYVAHRFTNTVMHSKRIRYIDGYPDFIDKNLLRYQKIVDTGTNEDGTPLTYTDRIELTHIIENADAIDAEYERARVTPPNIVFDDKLTLYSGDREIELLWLGQANTEGDIVMWLPKEKIVATGDIVVHPSPYAFNVPPKRWAETLRNINALDYEILVPGHGEVQRDTAYVDLNIEAAESIAEQRDAMLAKGMRHEEIETALDFSALEERFTGGDEYLRGYYLDYFEKPFRKAAIKALLGVPMVEIIPDDGE